MMAKGVVYKIFERAAGRGKAYSIKLDGDQNYYGTGFKAPGCKAGDYVEFEADKNAKGYWEAKLDSIRVLDSQPVEAAKAVGKVIGKDDYWTRKESRDLENDNRRNVGASLNTAIEFVELLLKAEAVKLPAKIPDREEAIRNLVVYYSTKFRTLETGTTEEPAVVEEEIAVAAQSNAANWE